MEKSSFKVTHIFEKSRCGIIDTNHGTIQTPVFMPVGTIGTVKAIFPEDLKKLNIQILLANTYHLMLRPGEDLIEKMGGLQKFMSWNRPILTDSGGFQIWSLSKLRKIDEDGVTFSSHLDGKKYRLTPKISINIQKKLNADITMALDECTDYPSSFSDTYDSLNLTFKWAKKSFESFKKNKKSNIFAIVQGGMYQDLRKLSAQQITSIDFDGFALGGLSVGESHKKMVEIIKYTLQFFPVEKPRYLMGVGRPVDIFHAVANGVDMFDCVIPTRFGRNGRAFSSTLGEINLRNATFAGDESPLDKNIDCFASQNFSKSYIHHLIKSNEILASMILSLHNVAFYEKMMLDIREAIKNKNFKTVMKNYLKIHQDHEKT